MKEWNDIETIYKYTLEAKESTILELPLLAQIISATHQNGNIVIYAVVDTEQIETTSYDFRTYGTGHKIHVHLSEYQFLNTVNMYDGDLVFHVFHKKIGA